MIIKENITLKKKREKLIILYFYTPLNKNHDEKIEYNDSSLRLERPRSYWIAMPNETNLSGKDFEITLKLNLQSIFQRVMKHYLVKVQS